jgi:hypothetical protein
LLLLLLTPISDSFYSYYHNRLLPLYRIPPLFFVLR